MVNKLSLVLAILYPSLEICYRFKASTHTIMAVLFRKNKLGMKWQMQSNFTQRIFRIYWAIWLQSQGNQYPIIIINSVILLYLIMPDAMIDQLIAKLQEELAANPVNFGNVLKLSSQLAKLDPRFQRFSIDAKTLIHLGRDSIKDHTTALLELVKNSYDADAHKVDIEILKDQDLIRIADNGFGMTRHELINNWLRIGFSNKRESKISDLGRRKTGEKGIGRISTDRLGAHIELRSKTQSDGIIGLKINWDEFDVEGKEVFDIDIEVIHPDSINIPEQNGGISITGTEIIIHGIRQAWTKKNIENLFYELAALTSPFSDVTDFEIELKNDIAIEFSNKVKADFLEAATIEVHTIFDGTNEVYYSIKDKYSTTAQVDTITLPQFFSRAKPNSTETNAPALLSGPLEVRLLFFLREAASVAESDYSLSDLREFLNNNNGVKIYRDLIAVKPYGFPKASFGYDWLGLGQRKVKNPAGISRADDYTVSPNQIVGAVLVSRDDNPTLVDSAAREGLIESDGFEDMKNFVLASLQLLESHYAKIYPQTHKAKEKEKFSAHKEAEKIKLQLSDVRDDLSEVKSGIESLPDNTVADILLKPIKKSINAVEVITEEVDTTITELLNWQRVSNGLATMGISYAVFGHETEGSITQFKGSVNAAKLVLSEQPPNVKKALEELEKAQKHSQKVAAWGAYALTRVQQGKRRRRKTQVTTTIANVIKELKPAFEAAHIQMRVSGDNFYVTTYPMDVETLLVNLLTNAYTAIVHQTPERIIEVKSYKEEWNGRDGFVFTVADSGPGIAKEFEHRIFEPLFSTKTAQNSESRSVGTGLGLTIVKSIVEELEGDVSFEKDAVLNGAKFKIWLPKID